MARVDEKIGMKQALKLHLWAAKVWWSIEPKLFLSVIFAAVAETILPYVTIWFSARIINELAGQRNPEVLLHLVLTTVAVTAGLSVFSHVLKRWKNAEQEMSMPLEERLMNEKLLCMEFAATEAASTKDIKNEMRFHQMGNVFGFGKVHHWYLEHLINAVASVIGATVLLYGFFAARVPESAPKFQWLDSPITNLVFVVLLLGSILLAQMMQAKGNQYHNEKIYPDINMYNRCCNSFGRMGVHL